MGSPQTVKKVKNGSTYYYERTPGYDPKTKNTAYKYRYVGKEMYGKVGRVRITLPRRSYIYGPFLPLVKIMDSLRMGARYYPPLRERRYLDRLLHWQFRRS